MRRHCLSHHCTSQCNVYNDVWRNKRELEMELNQWPLLDTTQMKHRQTSTQTLRGLLNTEMALSQLKDIYFVIHL